MTNKDLRQCDIKMELKLLDGGLSNTSASRPWTYILSCAR